MNPIYIEYYSHEQADCYKINLPWTRYALERIVLCKVSEGLERATELARQVLTDHLENALKQEIKD